MSSNKLTDLNTILFDQLQRLNDSIIEAKSLEIEIKRAHAVANVAKQIVSTHRLALDAHKIGSDAKPVEGFEMATNGTISDGMVVKKVEQSTSKPIHNSPKELAEIKTKYGKYLDICLDILRKSERTMTVEEVGVELSKRTDEDISWCRNAAKGILNVLIAHNEIHKTNFNGNKSDWYGTPETIKKEHEELN